MDAKQFYVPWESHCARCNSIVSAGPVRMFVHDLRCWSWRTAVYNLLMRARVVIEPDYLA